nr:MAG TPA: hypothetical protein [Caudoviricetes sp.]
MVQLHMYITKREEINFSSFLVSTIKKYFK